MSQMVYHQVTIPGHLFDDRVPNFIVLLKAYREYHHAANVLVLMLSRMSRLPQLPLRSPPCIALPASPLFLPISPTVEYTKPASLEVSHQHTPSFGDLEYSLLTHLFLPSLT